MIVCSTGQIAASLLSLVTIRVDVMNKTEFTQAVRVLVFDTSVSLKTLIFDETFTIDPASGDFRSISPTIFPDQYEVVVRSNTTNIVPYISGITTLELADPLASFKYGDLFIFEHFGVVTAP